MNLLRVLGRRAVQLVVLLLGVNVVVFLLLKITPGDPARLLLGLRASDAEVAAMRHQLHLDGGWLEQYLSYLGRVLTGDLGVSIRTGLPVSQTIADHAAVTAALLGLGVAQAVLISVTLAWYSSGRVNRIGDHLVRGVSVVLLAVPAFWLGLVLVVFIAIPSGYFPSAGLGVGGRGLVLPSFVIALMLTPALVRSLRAELLKARSSEHVAMAKAVGLAPWRVGFRHTLPNAVAPLVVLVAVQTGFALFGAVVVETTFALPGLGKTMTDAVASRDMPVVQGLTLVFAVVVVLINLGADLLIAAIDPRVELS